MEVHEAGIEVSNDIDSVKNGQQWIKGLHLGYSVQETYHPQWVSVHIYQRPSLETQTTMST